MSSSCGCTPSECTHVTDQVVLTTNGIDELAATVSQIKQTVPYNRNVAESYSFYEQYLSYLRQPVMFTRPNLDKLPIIPDPPQEPMAPGQKCSYPPVVTNPINPLGRVALVVGASKNTGLAIALILRCMGYHVIGTSRKPSAYTDVAQTVLSSVPLDIRDSESVKTFFDSVISPIGRLDIMIMCAGIGWSGPFTDVDGTDAQAYFNLKPIGYMRCINAAAPLMRRFGQTRIICFGDNWGSMSGLNPIFGGGTTIAAHAVTSLTQQMNVEERVLYSMNTITNPITYITVVPNFIRSTFNSYDVGTANSTNNANPLVAISNIIQAAFSLGMVEPSVPTTPVKIIAEQIGNICLARQPATMYLLGNPSIVFPDIGLTFIQYQTVFNEMSATDAVNATSILVDNANHVVTVPRVNELRMRLLRFFMSHRP